MAPEGLMEALLQQAFARRAGRGAHSFMVEADQHDAPVLDRHGRRVVGRGLRGELIVEAEVISIS